MRRNTLTVFVLLVLLVMTGVSLSVIAPQYRRFIALSQGNPQRAPLTEAIDGMYINLYKLNVSSRQEISRNQYPSREGALAYWDEGRFQLVGDRFIDCSEQDAVLMMSPTHFVSTWPYVYVFADGLYLIVDRGDGLIYRYTHIEEMPASHRKNIHQAEAGQSGVIYDVYKDHVRARLRR